MKKKLIVLLALILCLGVTASSAFAVIYPDTENHWSREAVNIWSTNGIVEGMPDGNYYPEKYMTRAEAAAIFARFLKLTDTGDCSRFSDMKKDAWYYEAISMCVKAGIMVGTSEITMSPKDYLTREQYFTMYSRALGLEPETELKTDKTFDDIDNISSWAKGDIYALLNAGYVQGATVGGGSSKEDTSLSGTKVKPKNEINRAAAMSFINQSVSTYITEAGTYQGKTEGITLVVTNQKVQVNGDQSKVVVIKKNADVVIDGKESDVTVAKAAVDAKVTVLGEGAGVNVKAADAEVKVTGSNSKVVVDESAAGTKLTATGEKTAVTIAADNTQAKVTGTGSTVAVDPASTASKVEAGINVAVKDAGTKTEIVSAAASSGGGSTPQVYTKALFDSGKGFSMGLDSNNALTVNFQNAASTGLYAEFINFAVKTYEVNGTVNGVPFSHYTSASAFTFEGNIPSTIIFKIGNSEVAKYIGSPNTANKNCRYTCASGSIQDFINAWVKDTGATGDNKAKFTMTKDSGYVTINCSNVQLYGVTFNNFTISGGINTSSITEPSDFGIQFAQLLNSMNGNPITVSIVDPE